MKTGIYHLSKSSEQYQQGSERQQWKHQVKASRTAEKEKGAR